MLRKLIFAAAAASLAGIASLAATPALASPWVNYDGYFPVNPNWVYFPPFGYPFAPYADVTVLAPVHVRVYAVPQQPPLYNVPPYPVYVPY